jgi:hypothetical protein
MVKRHLVIMDFRERLLYQQIHPAKLLTDWCFGLLSFYVLWQQQLALGIVVAVVPAIVVSILVLQFADLYKYKKSRLGIYVHKYVNTESYATRLFGFVVGAGGAWYHMPLLVAVGIVLVALGWLVGAFRN